MEKEIRKRGRPYALWKETGVANCVDCGHAVYSYNGQSIYYKDLHTKGCIGRWLNTQGELQGDVMSPDASSSSESEVDI